MHAANVAPGTLPADAGFLAEPPQAVSARAHAAAANGTVAFFMLCGLQICR
jgi:hypothetical protein